MPSFNEWTPHLNNYFLLLGFVLIVFVGLVKILKPEKLSSHVTASLFHKGLNFTFSLGLLVIVLSVGKGFLQAGILTNKQLVKDTQTRQQEINNNTGTVYQSGESLNIQEVK